MTFPPKTFGRLGVLGCWGSLAWLLASGPQQAQAQTLAAAESTAAAAATPQKPSTSPEPARPSVRFGGLIQVDWLVHHQASLDEVDPATADPLNQDRVLLRRGRLFGVARHRFVAGRLTLDANTVNGVQVRPYDAVVSARWPEDAPDERFSPGVSGDTALALERESGVAVLASAGLMRIPFGIETSEPTAFRPWLERSTWSTAFFGAGRDFGVSLDAVYRFLEASIALMNGEPLDTGRASGIDLNRSKDWVGRVGVSTVILPRLHMDAGFSFVSGKGFSPGTPQTKQTQTWTDNNQNGLVEVSELQVIAGTPAVPSENFSRSAIGADLRLRFDLPWLGPLTLWGELARAENLDRAVERADPVAAGRPLRELGWSVGVAQRLTQYGELAVRYDRYNPDFDDRRAQGSIAVPNDPTYSTWAFAAAVRWSTARLLAEYDLRDNALGVAENGAPTRLESNSLTFRAELTF